MQLRVLAWVDGRSISLASISVNVVMGGLIGLLTDALIGDRGADVQPFEIIAWSWRRFLRVSHLRNALLIGLIVGLINFVIFSWATGLSYGIFGAVVGWLLSGPFSGLSSNVLDEHNRVVPNQGIRRSAKNSVLIGLSGGLAAGLVIGLTTAALLFEEKGARETGRSFFEVTAYTIGNGQLCALSDLL